MSDNQIGFIILRHVNDEVTNQYWICCYESIRKYYPENPIMMIDDNSNYNYITNQELYKTTIIDSEYPGRGELLPYYYYLHNKLFDTAVILHDSTIINHYIDLNVDKYKILWDFQHDWDQIEDETKLIQLFNDVDLLRFYEKKSLWTGCFGGMSIITFDFLQSINMKYELRLLLDHIVCRFNRCSFERVIACLLQKEYPANVLLGDIHLYSPTVRFNDKDKYTSLPITKYWTGR